MGTMKAAKLAWIYDLYRMSQSTLARGSTDQIPWQVIRDIVAGMEAHSGTLALRDGAP